MGTLGHFFGLFIAFILLSCEGFRPCKKWPKAYRGGFGTKKSRSLLCYLTFLIIFVKIVSLTTRMYPMKRFEKGAMVLLALCMAACSAPEETTDLKLHYDREARIWVEALPIGNSRLGAMIYGGVRHEELQLNEETVWGGSPHNNVKPYNKAGLDSIRQLLLFTLSPMRMGFTSPRSTALNQMLQSRPMVTSPTMVAFSDK